MTVVDRIADLVTRPLRRVEYDALIAKGFLVGEPIELVEGQLVIMAPQGDLHWLTVTRLSRLLFDAIPADEGTVSVQGPLAADDLSEPEPDLYVTAPEHASQRGLPMHASLVIEVAASSRAYDLGVKARLYARVGIADYWVVDVNGRRMIVHRDPGDDGYASIDVITDGTVTALRHPAMRVDIAALLHVDPIDH
ncbi:Uma2 family endonuclease [soil metagenome]